MGDGPGSGYHLYEGRRTGATAESPGPVQSFITLSALQTWYTVKGEFRRAKEIGRQTLAVAHELNDPVLQIRASAIMAVVLNIVGSYVKRTISRRKLSHATIRCHRWPPFARLDRTRH